MDKGRELSTVPKLSLIQEINQSWEDGRARWGRDKEPTQSVNVKGHVGAMLSGNTLHKVQ